MLTWIGSIPFALATLGANSFVHIQNLGIGIKTVGNANLRFLVQVTNSYTPISAETVTFRLKVGALD
jgi:hypothetical protein